MTLNDAPAFRALVRQVAAGRGKRLSDDDLDGLWLLLSDMSYADLERGLVSAARETRWFPSPAEVRAHAAKAQADAAVRPAVLAMLANDEVHCDVCDDTGWAETTRDASRVYGEGATVVAVRACGCRAANPIYQAKRATTRRVGSNHE